MWCRTNNGTPLPPTPMPAGGARDGLVDLDRRHGSNFACRILCHCFDRNMRTCIYWMVLPIVNIVCLCKGISNKCLHNCHTCECVCKHVHTCSAGLELAYPHHLSWCWILLHMCMIRYVDVLNAFANLIAAMVAWNSRMLEFHACLSEFSYWCACKCAHIHVKNSTLFIRSLHLRMKKVACSESRSQCS